MERWPPNTLCYPCNPTIAPHLAVQNTWKYCFINYHNIIHLSVYHDRLPKLLKQRRSSYYFIIKTYWFTNWVSYNTATVILNNKRNFNGFLAGLARWFQPHPIQQRLKIPPFNFGLAYARIGGFRLIADIYE